MATLLSRGLICLLAAGLLAVPVGGAAASGEAPREPFFPRIGNAGYDALHYDVDLAFQPRGDRIEATLELRARTSQRLRRFSLDLFGLRVDSVRVDGEPSEFNRGRGKLKIEPPTPIRRGAEFTVLVRYRGQPQTVIDPDGGREGWIDTPDGAFAVGEPIGTASWLPCNDTPADKASFDVALTVPSALKAVSNGRLRGVERRGGRSTYSWRETAPMSPYLAVVAIGRGKLLREEIAGLPSWTLIDPRLARDSLPILARLGEVIRFQQRAFGPYPFDSAGSIVDFSPGVGYALETQSRPIYLFVPDLTTLVHETAHQWFGNSVGIERWPDIWLNEGFATWAQWHYAEHHGGRSAREIFRTLYRVPATNGRFWNPPPGNPGSAKNIFATSTYVRGAMTLEALRIKVGTGPMLRVVRRWAAIHRHGSARIGQFIALAEELTGEDLGPFFERWLYRRGKP